MSLRNLPIGVIVQGLTGGGKEEQTKNVTITENGTTTVTPDADYTLSEVNITTNVQPDTSDATAAASDILINKTAYTATGKVTGTLNAEPIDTNLTFYFPFDKYTTDKLMHPVYSNSMSIDKSIYKKGGGSLRLTGSSAYMYIATTDDCYLSGDFTIEFFIYKTDTLSYSSYIVSTSWNTSTANRWCIRVNANNTVQFVQNDGITDHVVETGILSIPNTTWHHIAICRKINDIKIFFDGVLQVESEFEYQLCEGETVYIGQPVGGGSSDFRCRLDELKIYNGYAKYENDFVPD